MYIAILFGIFLVWLFTKLVKGAGAVLNYNPNAIDIDQADRSFRAAVSGRYDLEEKVKKEMKLSDVWDVLGYQPTPEEEKAWNDPLFLYKDELLKSAIMSQQGKLGCMFIFDQYYPTHDKVQRALIEKLYLKIEDNLEAHGIHNVVIFEPPSQRIRFIYNLHDEVEKRGYGVTKYGDTFNFAGCSRSDINKEALFLLEKPKGVVYGIQNH